jgi:hypothetical protein
MKRLAWATVVMLAVLAVILLPAPAAACSCMQSGPPCQALFASDAVFVGTVKGIDVRKDRMINDRAYERRIVSIAIDGPSRGVQASTIEVWTGMGNGDCGFKFVEGQRYVVYAYRAPDGALGTGICSRTRLYSEAAEDVAYLQSGPPASAAARVLGTVTVGQRNPDNGNWEQRPVADVQINLRGSAGVFSGSTDAAGRYAIAGVPRGAYEAEALPPALFSSEYLISKFEIKDTRACQVQDFYLRYAGLITGTILDARGAPVAGARVEIARVGEPPNTSNAHPYRPESDAGGRFELSEVQPGSYVIGVGLTPSTEDQVQYPATWYPGTPDSSKAEQIEVTPAARVQLKPWTIPERLARRELTGIVVWPDGTPVANASVVLNVGSHQASEVVRTDGVGAFTLPAFDRQTYVVRAYLNIPGPPFRQAQASQTVQVSSESAPIRLVLEVR